MGIKRPLYKPILTPALSLKERVGRLPDADRRNFDLVALLMRNAIM
jgi:hypothetical protein